MLAGLALVVACGCAAEPVANGAATEPAPAATEPAPEPAGPSKQSSKPPRDPGPTPEPTSTEPRDTGSTRPAWLGSRVLPERPDGLGEIRDTPPELADRRFPPPDADPVDDEFVASVEPVPADVAERSTWRPDCPVDLDELRYVTMSFWGFDDRTHRGEMIVNATVAAGVVTVFERLYDARFPIEEMRVVAVDELDAPPTGDGNNTTAFVCRPTTLGDSWSEHAYGLAVDVNPFHNPYQRADAVVPELASAYLDRDRDRAGMIQPGDVVTTAFADIGWGWGGDWRSLKDWMHFSQSGR